MSTHNWEQVASGRYATEYQGHVLQAIRKDGPYERDQRPYIAIVDRVPLDPGEWSLNRAKTRAIQFVERQNGKTRAESLFKKPNGHKPSEPIPEPDHAAALEGVFEEMPEPEPQPEPQPRPILRAPITLVKPAPSPSSDQAPLGRSSATIQAHITDPDLLRAIASLRETLSLMREFADVRCTLSLPPTLEL